MKQFKGPKFQQGKLGGDWEDEAPSTTVLAKQLAKKAKVSSITVGDEEILYIYCDIGDRHYSTNKLETMAKEIKATFYAMLGVQIIVGYYDMKFTPITKKQGFKGMLNGQLQS